MASLRRSGPTRQSRLRSLPILGSEIEDCNVTGVDFGIKNWLTCGAFSVDHDITVVFKHLLGLSCRAVRHG